MTKHKLIRLIFFHARY